MNRFAVTVTLLLATAAIRPAIAADATAGAQVFKTQCSACHATVAGANKVGPSLAGLVGRKSGSVEGFHYSAANRAAPITWTPDVLDKYLANPRAVVPGTIMPYVGLKNDAQRADLIAYLATLQ